jgi:NTP pyrophosphatase (non-canonical NTP hydrolase)
VAAACKSRRLPKEGQGVSLAFFLVENQRADQAQDDQMNIDTICSAADGEHNEDLIVVFENDGFTDIVIIDGGSSVADKNYIDSEIGDVVWFVKNFCLYLKKVIGRNRSQEDSVVLALSELHSAFREKTGAVPIPPYAYPIAAMTWLRITDIDGALTLHAYCLGDCKTFLYLPDQTVLDLDPYVNPQELILQAEILKLTQEGVVDVIARRERLMPMLRARREFLNSTASPSVLCLEPRGPIEARVHTAPLDRAAALLAMTDGFYRIVDTYRMHTIEELAHLCLRKDLKSILKELRDFEMASLGSSSLSVKGADDASAMTCSFS